MRQTVVWFGALIALVMIGLKVLEYSYLSFHINLEIYVTIIALLFLGGGVWIGRKWFGATPSDANPIVEEQVQIPDPDALRLTGISKREQEVLECLAQGFSNQEIADRLFVSLNTIKTHLNNLYAKLEVKRRTQAVARAKELKIIP